MKAKTLIILVIITGAALQTMAQTDTTRNKRDTSSNRKEASGNKKNSLDTSHNNHNKRDTAWSKRTEKDTGWNKNNRRDTLGLNHQESENRSVNSTTQTDSTMSSASDNQSRSDKDLTTSQGGRGTMPNIDNWPEASRTAAQEMMTKYGEPDMAGEELLIWKDKGPWKSIEVSKEETEHHFPLAHTDMMKQCIQYKVPADKMDDLARFDGSIQADRTQGLLSARCDKEANNILGLNLAHDIIIGKKTVEQARAAFAKIAKEKMKGGNPEYMQRLVFEPNQNSKFTDVNTTGLDKEGKPVAKR